MTMEEEAKSLRQELKTRDQHRKEFDLDELKGQTSQVQKQDAEQSSKAHQLAQEASKMAAALTEKLAYSNKEKLELTSRLEEARQELHKARRGERRPAPQASERPGAGTRRVPRIGRKSTVFSARSTIAWPESSSRRRSAWPSRARNSSS
jgi:hypothetical protein